ncbi:MAG: hypothetical protein B7Z75_00430 [Acidocella sp. 20-57-95]|nr:MAG: hypothetical protein B7Z75_00430 [Acidocella sp. 20-57-95]
MQGSDLLKNLKLRAYALLPPAVFLAITWYFGWNAVHGTRGMEAQAVQQAALEKAKADFKTVEAARNEWEIKVADLADQSIVKDMLDGEARAVSNLAAPTDLVVELPPIAAPATAK